MRPRAARRFAAVLLLMLCWAPCVPRDARSEGASADSTARPAAPPDSVARAGGAPRDTSRAAAARTIAPTRVPVARAIDVGAERKVGAVSLEDILPLRRPVFLNPLPPFPPSQGVLALPDGGCPTRRRREAPAPPGSGRRGEEGSGTPAGEEEG